MERIHHGEHGADDRAYGHIEGAEHGIKVEHMVHSIEKVAHSIEHGNWGA